MADSLKKYLLHWKRLTGRQPAFEFVLPLVTSMIELKKPPLPEVGLLRKPLHTASMMCAMPGCRFKRKVCHSSCFMHPGACMNEGEVDGMVAVVLLCCTWRPANKELVR